jgi:two-component system, OmpR family, response regulator
MHLLILSHHPLQAKFLQKGLRYENIGADRCRPENLHKMWYGQYDAILLPLKSWTFPAFPKIIKTTTPLKNTPLIILHQKQPDPALRRILQKYDNIHLLSSLTPFRDIIIKLKTLKNQPLADKTFIEVGDLAMDIEKKEVFLKGKLKRLCNKEFSLLECFMRNAGKTLSRTFLLENVWDRNATILSNTVDVHINRLRHKIKPTDKTALIETVPMAGYKLSIDLLNPKRIK